MAGAGKPNCMQCRHFFVTWEPDKPRGCRAYEFKAAEMPSDVVMASSGEPCRLFEGKPRAKSERRLVR